MNCKPGDLAVIIKTDYPVNLGKIVQCLEHVIDFEGEDAWVCVTSGSPCFGIDWTTNEERFDRITECPDAWLRPIRGNEEPTEETKELELEL